MAKQAVFTLADRLLRADGGATNDGIRLVPIVVFVQVHACTPAHAHPRMHTHTCTYVPIVVFVQRIRSSIC